MSFFAERTEERIAPVGVTGILPWVKWLFKTIVRKGVRTYEFNLGRMVENHSDDYDIDVCAGYMKAHKYGKGNTFGECDEGQDYDEGPGVVDSGPLIVREIDFMGARGRKTRGAALLLVVGRSGRSPHRDPNDKGVASLPVPVRMLPYYPDWGYVKVDGMIRSEIPTENGIVQMQGGDCIKYSDDPAVPVHRFDPQTGFCGWWKGRLCVHGVHAVTGEVVSMRTFPA